MSDDNFPLMPPWEDMDFTANCTAWGNWLATWFLPNPWDRLQILEGGYSPTFTLIDSAVPEGIVARVLDGNSSITLPKVLSKTHEWWSYHLYNMYEWDADGAVLDYDLDSAFWLNVMEPGMYNCQKEVCKAQAYTGNADITGIGVGLLSHCLSCSIPIKFPAPYIYCSWRGYAKVLGPPAHSARFISPTTCNFRFQPSPSSLLQCRLS